MPSAGYDVVVQRDLERLSAQLKELFPKESIEVRANGRTAVLSGSVSSKDVADKMASLAGSFVESKEELVSLLQVGPAGRSNQVLLQVRFAEVSRSAMTELGLGIFTSATGIEQHHRTCHDPAVSGARVRGALGHQGELGVRV